MNLVINTDGASRGNPGPASYGYLIKENGVILHEEGKQIGINTNNVAEYTAVLKAFEYILENFTSTTPHKIEVVADSKLVVEQLSGRYKIKSPHLLILIQQIKALESQLGEVTYRSVLRHLNKEADRLANLAFEK